MARNNRNGRNRKGGNAMAYGTGVRETPEIEDQPELPRPVDGGKGLNASSFSDEGTPFEIFKPHRPHENPAGRYDVIDGPGVDNTREPHGGRRDPTGRGRRGR